MVLKRLKGVSELGWIIWIRHELKRGNNYISKYWYKKLWKVAYIEKILLLKETSRPTFKVSFSYILPEIEVIPERIFKM
jgi:hypothetical protein